MFQTELMQFTVQGSAADAKQLCGVRPASLGLL
jgi:hypothetical protein